MSKDAVSCELDGVVFFRIDDPVEAVVSLENAKTSTKLLAQTTMRNVVGTKTINEILPGRDAISKQIQSVLDQVTTNWGIKVSFFVGYLKFSVKVMDKNYRLFKNKDTD